MSEQKLDWMYKGVSGLVDREAYLMGRKIDKTFELAMREEKGERIDAPSHDSVPTSLLSLPSNNKSLDLAVAMREDPLFEIKRRQIEEARKILNNPLKLKRIKELVESTLKSDKSSSKKKKSKKRRKNSRNKDGDSSNGDDDIRKRKHKKSHRHKHRSISPKEKRKSRSRSRSPRDKIKSRLRSPKAKRKSRSKHR